MITRSSHLIRMLARLIANEFPLMSSALRLETDACDGNESEMSTDSESSSSDKEVPKPDDKLTPLADDLKQHGLMVEAYAAVGCDSRVGLTN